MPFPSFKEVKRTTKENLLIWLEAPANSGKSTFCTELFRQFNPGVVIPSDQRDGMYKELLDEGIQVHPITADPTQWNDENAILKSLSANIPGSGVQAIVWDSLSPKFRKLITEAQDIAELPPQERKAVTGNTNKAAAYQPKAKFMEKVASVAAFGTHVVWVAHEFEGGDRQGKDVTKTTITKQERAKFERNLNLHLRTGIEGSKYYIQVVWARERPELLGTKFYDEQGMFRGMIDRLIEAYEGATVVVFDEVPYWPTPEQAIKAALEVEVDGVFAFTELKHATNAYEKLKKEVIQETDKAEWKANNAKDKFAAVKLMATRWREDVYERIADKAADLKSASEEQVLEPAGQEEMQPELMDGPPEPPPPYPD